MSTDAIHARLRARTLIDELLGEQRHLTAVDEFARWHGRAPGDGGRYRNLLPLNRPAPGEQYAFEVDLDRCSGCKACVSACHSLNGLDAGETWRSVGTLIRLPPLEPPRRPAAAAQRFVTTACHHCVDPACLNGCPVLAYDKDPATGIVRHLDDQCIGCHYCVMMCPYEVPRYSASRGIVRKCDLCTGRLAVGEAPACARACPNEAIRITVVNRTALVEQYRGPGAVAVAGGDNPFLPHSPAPAITVPATRFVTRDPEPGGWVPADAGAAVPAPAHWPLVGLLLLTQVSVGLEVAAVALPSSAIRWASALAGIAGLLVGTAHLGRPLKAWRAFLGWRRSWFSREVIAFGVSVPLILAAAAWPVLVPAAAAAGIMAVGCSVMIYVATRRPGWDRVSAGTRFSGTVALTALAAWWIVDPGFLPAFLLSVLTLVRLGAEGQAARGGAGWDRVDPGAPERAARLWQGSLGWRWRLRVAAALVGGIVLPWVALVRPGDGSPGVLLAVLAAGVLAGAEVLERHLFFTAMAADRMPGGGA